MDRAVLVTWNPRATTQIKSFTGFCSGFLAGLAQPKGRTAADSRGRAWHAPKTSAHQGRQATSTELLQAWHAPQNRQGCRGNLSGLACPQRKMSRKLCHHPPKRRRATQHPPQACPKKEKDGGQELGQKDVSRGPRARAKSRLTRVTLWEARVPNATATPSSGDRFRLG